MARAVDPYPDLSMVLASLVAGEGRTQQTLQQIQGLLATTDAKIDVYNL